MNSENTAQKMSVAENIRRHAPEPSATPSQPALWT
jgi:hypothetical protein